MELFEVLEKCKGCNTVDEMLEMVNTMCKAVDDVKWEGKDSLAQFRQFVRECDKDELVTLMFLSQMLTHMQLGSLNCVREEKQTDELHETFRDILRKLKEEGE